MLINVILMIFCFFIDFCESNVKVPLFDYGFETF